MQSPTDGTLSTSLTNNHVAILLDIDLNITVAQKGQAQISLPKRKTISQNTISLPNRHKTVSQNTNQIPKTQISLPKHKTISQNINQFSKTQISLPKHKSISKNTNQSRRNTNQKTGHLLCYYQRAWKGLIPRIFRV